MHDNCRHTRRLYLAFQELKCVVGTLMQSASGSSFTETNATNTRTFPQYLSNHNKQDKQYLH